MSKNSLVIAWIAKANRYLGTAATIFEHKPEYTDIVCYHCQQAVEKYLKAYLTCLSIDFRRSHDLTYLLDLLSEQESFSDEFYDYAQELEGYAVEVRYPGGLDMPTSREARESIDIARKFKVFIEDKINTVLRDLQ
jgi:HEPN domain-containing protein